MCGITGFWQSSGVFRSVESLSNIAKGMTDTLLWRGPDDSGVWVDATESVALGHRRLAIVDLSPAGHQPMKSSSSRFVIVFNGEIYNHQVLRAELQAEDAAPTWRGHSDTETILAGFEHWGIEATLLRCVGMFAIAVYNRENKTLTLARDRFGEKPLYYGWIGKGDECALAFGSELKSLKAYPSFEARISTVALAQYLRFMYVPSPLTIYQGIFKLEPGCLLTVQEQPPQYPPIQPLQPGQTHGSASMKRWWSLRDVVEAGTHDAITNEIDALRLLESTVSEAVELQSLADVPLGAFLSGGVDSSMIVALMQQKSSRPVKTFTIGFDEAGFDESSHALAVARYLGTDHYEMRVTAQMAQGVIPQLPQVYDEPFADSSQIPTYLLCQAARQHVTVALSGDAGDELFGGYNRYLWGPGVWNKMRQLPMPARQALGKLLMSIPMNTWDTIGKPLRAVSRLGEKLHKLGARMQSVRSMDELYFSLVTEWQDPASLVRTTGETSLLESPNWLDTSLSLSGVDEASLRMMYQDAMTYLPDDILCKVDRAAMACSLETRVPFLDHRVVDLAWRLPLHMKIRGNVGKWALRQVLYKYVPRDLIERPKSGFAIPIGQWLRGPLRAWAEELLAEHRLETEGYLYPGPVRRAWAEHVKGQCDHTAKLWAVLMFQAWLQEQSKQTDLAS